MTSLGSVGSVGGSLPGGGSSLPDVGPAIPDFKPDDALDENQFQVPASVPQHQLRLPGDDAGLHVSFTRFQEEEHASMTSSKSSRHIPERRLPSKKRKMSYESYDSAMGDSYLGLASLDSGVLPKLQADVGSVTGSGASTSNQHPGLKLSALDHLDALGGSEDGMPAPVLPRVLAEGECGFTDPPPAARGGADDNSEETFTSSGHRLLMEAIMMSGGLEGSAGARRKRFESWGGMSDLSVPMGPDQGSTAAAIAASAALHHTGIFDDVTAAAFGGGSVASSVTDEQLLSKPSAGEGMPGGRDRKESTTSFSDTTFPVPSSLDGLEIPSDLQKFVAAAVASVGDHLAEWTAEPTASAVENTQEQGMDEISSIATQPLIGTSLEDPSRITVSGQSSAEQVEGDTGSSNNDVGAAASSAAISVDYDAVAAAVDAANAATGGLDLSTIIGDGTLADLPGMSTGSSFSSGGCKTKRRRRLPTSGRTASQISLLGDVPKSSLSEKEQEEIRERARKAAGYVPPPHVSNAVVATPAKGRDQQPLNKRTRKMTPEPTGSKAISMPTPKVSNTSKQASRNPGVATPGIKPKASGTKSKEKSTQKWDNMFACLIQFVADRKSEETAVMSPEALADWVWDGNVPTTYKTKDGKALGRWINNQRSAKSKGSLRDDREQRLVGAGLKWSVLASNSWNEMLDELRLYIKEYTKDGKKWDGNVPTNYRIKAKSHGKKMSEDDKNLGRWVNRQRSLYQAGKLREDRQLALEKVGLKWSMLATTSWEAMFDTLVAYVDDKEKKGVKWDGNVPANYRTDEGRALGRWINRQRSANVKKKLKQEYVEKLSKLGLKWSVHERKYVDDSHNNAQSKIHGVSLQAVAPGQRAQIPATIAVPAKTVDLNPADQAKVVAIAKTAKIPSVRFDEGARKCLLGHTAQSAAKGSTTAKLAPHVTEAVAKAGPQETAQEAAKGSTTAKFAPLFTEAGVKLAPAPPQTPLLTSKSKTTSSTDRRVADSIVQKVEPSDDQTAVLDQLPAGKEHIKPNPLPLPETTRTLAISSPPTVKAEQIELAMLPSRSQATQQVSLVETSKSAQIKGSILPPVRIPKQMVSFHEVKAAQPQPEQLPPASSPFPAAPEVVPNTAEKATLSAPARSEKASATKPTALRPAKVATMYVSATPAVAMGKCKVTTCPLASPAKLCFPLSGMVKTDPSQPVLQPLATGARTKITPAAVAAKTKEIKHKMMPPPASTATQSFVALEKLQAIPGTGATREVSASAPATAPSTKSTSCDPVSEAPSNGGDPKAQAVPLAPDADTNENKASINKSSGLPVRKSAPLDGGNKEWTKHATPPAADASMGFKYEAVLSVPNQALKDGDGTMPHHEPSQKEVVKCNVLPPAALMTQHTSAKAINAVPSIKNAVKVEGNIAEQNCKQSREAKNDLAAPSAAI